jgi:hypothetical protein
MKQCGNCTACCKLLAVPALDKPPNVKCAHVQMGKGCRIYDKRPQECRNFNCLWLQSPVLGWDLKPNQCGVVFETFMEDRLVLALVAEHRPKAWMSGNPRKLILQMLNDGFAVWVLSGGEKHMLLPPGQTEEDIRQRTLKAAQREVK